VDISFQLYEWWLSLLKTASLVAIPLFATALALYGPCNIDNTAWLDVLSGLHHLIGPDDGPGVESGDTGDVDSPDDPVGPGDKLGLDIVLEVGGDDYTFNNAFPVDNLSTDAFLGLNTSLGVDLGAELSLLTHSSLCPGHKDLPGVNLGPGDCDELSVESGLDLGVELCPGHDHLLGWHGLDLGAGDEAGVGAGNEDGLGWELAGLHLSPGHKLGLDAGLAWNGTDNSPSNHLVLEVGGGDLSELGLDLCAGNIDGTFAGLGVLHDLCAESGLGLSNETGLTGNGVGNNPLSNLSTCHGVGHELCVLNGINLRPCDFNNPGDIDNLCPEVGACYKDLGNLGAGNNLGSYLDLGAGHNYIRAVITPTERSTEGRSAEG